ncbi:MAG TPA: alanine racemase [Candidatus Saccharimonadales bacterium]|nr:alanine racemase [Candidatus Saccharimonadales bacterium]
MHTRPNWAEISLSALAENYQVIARHLGPGITPCCVIKCDAYGHGVIESARALEQAGALWLGVTSTEEGLAVREAGVKLPILVMTGFWRGEEETLLRYELTPAVATLEHIEAIERAATTLGPVGRKVPVHLKVDTGMARLGVSLAELPALAVRIAASPVVELQGVFSHLAESEILDSPAAATQRVDFERAIELLAAAGLHPRYRHLANTAATVARPDTWNNMVRPGLALYGYNLKCEGPGAEEATLPVRPVLTWKTRVIALRDIAPGTPVGYNQRWRADRPTRLAVIPVGYGDGFIRHLSKGGRVVLHDHYAPIAGNVSMDLTMIDVTEIPETAIGDEVLLIGRSEHCSVGADDMARLAGTIVYEILCGLSPRVPRVYVE